MAAGVAVQCCAGRGKINKSQQNSGYQLQEKDGERGAAEHVEPARRISRHRMFRDLANGCCQLQATVEPFSDFANHDAHGGFSPVSDAIAAPGVGSSPACIVTTPIATL